MAQATAQIGVTGLGVMGRNLARNFARHGYTVALHNRTVSRMTAVIDQFGHEGNFVPAATAEEFVQALERPRRLVIMVNAGAATDAVIDEFAPLLEEGDMIIDGGNAHFHDTRRREAKLKEQGLHFVGMGVSGGEEGALNGPSIMPGGSAGVLRSPSARCWRRSAPTWTAPRAAPTSARTGPATSSRWCTTASSTPTCSSSPRPTTCSGTASASSRPRSPRRSGPGTPAGSTRT